jgi:hypothetical protein
MKPYGHVFTLILCIWCDVSYRMQFMSICRSSVWVARKPPGFAFIDFDDKRDAEDAICDLDGM